jgi:hypothetical protein
VASGRGRSERERGGPEPEARRRWREPPIDRRPELLADSSRRARRGALELVAALLVLGALVALAVWFLLFAHNPLLRP